MSEGQTERTQRSVTLNSRSLTRGQGAGHSPGSGRPVSTVNQQGTRRSVEHHGVASSGGGPPTCWDHLLPIAATGTIKAETEEARGEEVVLGAATRHIEPDVVHQGSCMTCQAWGPRGTGGRLRQEFPAAPAQRTKGPHVIGERAISQLTTHQHQGAGPGHSHVGVTGSLWEETRRQRWRGRQMVIQTARARQSQRCRDTERQTDGEAETDRERKTGICREGKKRQTQKDRDM